MQVIRGAVLVYDSSVVIGITQQVRRRIQFRDGHSVDSVEYSAAMVLSSDSSMVVVLLHDVVNKVRSLVRKV